MTATRSSKRQSAVATRARKARKWAKDGIPRQRIADDLGISLRSVDRYIAQGKAAEPKPRPRRPATLDEMRQMEHDAANPTKKRNPNLGFIDRDQLLRLNRGGSGFDPPTWWLDTPKIRHDALGAGLLRDPVLGVLYDPNDPKDVARIERLREQAAR